MGLLIVSSSLHTLDEIVQELQDDEVDYQSDQVGLRVYVSDHDTVSELSWQTGNTIDNDPHATVTEFAVEPRDM